jgi:four helix bundle protein
MNSDKGYQKLIVWQESHKFLLHIYHVTKSFPRDELFGLVSQIRRAAVSVAANIVEGQTRSSRNSFIQFLFIANGSLAEVEYYLELARDLCYITEQQYEKLEEKRKTVGGLLGGLIRSKQSYNS